MWSTCPGWWDWNLGPVPCDQGEDELIIFTVHGSAGTTFTTRSLSAADGSNDATTSADMLKSQRSQAKISAGGQVQMHADGTSHLPLCWSLWDYPVGGFEVQYWAKPLPNGDAALYVLNTNTTHAKTVSISLSTVFEIKLGTNSNLNSNLSVEEITVSIRDIWGHKDNGTAVGVLEATVDPADSLFYRLSKLA